MYLIDITIVEHRGKCYWQPVFTIADDDWNLILKNPNWDSLGRSRNYPSDSIIRREIAQAEENIMRALALPDDVEATSNSA